MLQTMARTRSAERKPLSFSTTMRNPDRIAGFLNCIIPFEGQRLTEDVITNVAINLITQKLYYTQQYEMRVPEYKAIYYDEDRTFTREQAKDIILNSPQNHKEAGFEKGWPSRFDTWYKLPKEFGFLSYAMDQPIRVSRTGHMLVDAYNEVPINEQKVQNVLLNAMMKYQTNNPFRRNQNNNVPLVLLLNVLRLLKADKKENGAGVSRQELSLFICWPDSSAEALYRKIKEIRAAVGYNYSDEYMYEICLKLLEADDSQRNRFKMNQICGEAVDEYIRKMRSTGIVTLRGNGRFLDFNTFEQEKIDYIIDNYSGYRTFDNDAQYYAYMGEVDPKILEMPQKVEIDLTDVRKQALHRYAKEFSTEKVADELKRVCNKRESTDAMLKFIGAPTRLEFLVSIALVQQFDRLDVNPNYSVDDEGLPRFTAGGGIADIVCYDTDYDSLFEVTLMCGRQDQVNNEIVPIRRHLLEYKQSKENVFSVFVAPIVHEDTKEMTLWYQHKDHIDIVALDINAFLQKIAECQRVSQLRA